MNIHDQRDRADPKLAAHYAARDQRPALFTTRFGRLLSDSSDIVMPCAGCRRPMRVTAFAVAVARTLSEVLVKRGEPKIEQGDISFLCDATDYRDVRDERGKWVGDNCVARFNASITSSTPACVTPPKTDMWTSD